MSREYKPDDLYESIQSEFTIECDNCGSQDRLHYTDEYAACQTFFDYGWRSTPNKTYCPQCANKKLKTTPIKIKSL